MVAMSGCEQSAAHVFNPPWVAHPAAIKSASTYLMLPPATKMRDPRMEMEMIKMSSLISQCTKHALDLM